jgi:CelD/BcsL family acetyltransferase involved in cellulose biosynthesis
MTATTRPAARGDAATAVGPGGDALWTSACIDAFGLSSASLGLDGIISRGRRLELAGPGELYEPGDFACSDADSRAQLAEMIAATGYPLAVMRIPAASETIAALRGCYPVVVVRPAGACPYVDLDGDPERSLPKRRREDLRRSARRAERSGGFDAVIHEPNPDDVDGLLDLAYGVEASSWKLRNGTALVQDAQRAAFYLRYARAAAATGSLRVAVLEVGGQTAAVQIAVEQDGAYWLLKIGYDERFAHVSPGQLLLLETLRWSAERNLDRYEFLGQATAWTRAWTRTERPCSAVYAYPSTLRGIRCLVRDGASRLRKRSS